MFSIPLQIFKKRGVGRGGTNQRPGKNDLQKIENKFTGFFIGVSTLPVITGLFALQFFADHFLDQ